MQAVWMLSNDDVFSWCQGLVLFEQESTEHLAREMSRVPIA